MSAQYSYNTSKIAKTLSEEQFEQILDAILSGKYSWACVLILRFAGYNPLHYIPYRTYNRLTKDNHSNRQSPSQTVPVESSLKTKTSANVTQIRDLTYLEPIPEVGHGVSGGCRNLDNSKPFSTHWTFN